MIVTKNNRCFVKLCNGSHKTETQAATRCRPALFEAIETAENILALV